MDWKIEWKHALSLVIVFVIFYYLPIGTSRFDNALMESLYLIKWYVREHVILCLIPAFFIAGAISVFINQEHILRYLGSKANKIFAYGISSISGTILAVCSCTVLPLFAGIHKKGAGLGPAISFLYSGPAINVMAIILTARILGFEIGIARAIGAVGFSVIIGLLMEIIFQEDKPSTANLIENKGYEDKSHEYLWKNALYFGLMILILVFSTWSKPDNTTGLWHTIFVHKWLITAVLAMLFSIVLVVWFNIKWWMMGISIIPAVAVALLLPNEPVAVFLLGVLALSISCLTSKGKPTQWFNVSWDFAKQIFPLLLIGVFIAGFLLGRPGTEGLIPSKWINYAVGGNSIFSNFLASVAGAFMYFATLTEVPIVQGLIGSGMGKGPALSLLLAGPALSLPSMLVINTVLGAKKTITYISLVIVMATITGKLYGYFF
ncbi:MAG: permease [Candidatus Magnetoovum sp. WYHC-5]|nr:permease [Candidatus Magnetoovum sp. WYHC-5]